MNIEFFFYVGWFCLIFGIVYFLVKRTVKWAIIMGVILAVLPFIKSFFGYIWGCFL